MNKKELLHKWLYEELKFDEKDRLKKKKMYGHFDVYCYSRRSIIKLSEKFLIDKYIKSWDFLPLMHYWKKENKYDWFSLKKKWKLLDKKEVRYKWKPEKIKYRSICYASHRDSILYNWYWYIINSLYEKALNDPKNNLSEVVGAYRINNWITVRSNITLANEVFQEIKKRDSCAVLTFDIQKFYDTLDNSYLKKTWVKLLQEYWDLTINELPEDHYAIFRSITKYSVIHKPKINQYLNNKYGKTRSPEEILANYWMICDWDDFEKMRKRGLVETKEKFIKTMQLLDNENYKVFDVSKWVPQWTPISPILSNIYLLEFDSIINKIVLGKGGIYRRYADDIMIICNIEDRDFLEKKLTNEIINFNLVIQEKKTDWFEFQGWHISQRKILTKEIVENEKVSTFEYLKERSLQYLWYDFNGKNIYIRWWSISKYYRKMKNAIKKNIWKPFSAWVKPESIKIDGILNNFTKKRFISYVKNSVEIMKDEKMLNQIKNSERNVRKFHELSLLKAKKKLFAIKRRRSLKKKKMI